jgi:endonuclease/exonuclease/phosphatase family metal-dependent hydrolase
MARAGIQARTAAQPASLAAAAPLRVLTINTHKGLSPWNRRFMLAELREAVRSTAADLVFLQEVIGEKLGRAALQVPHYEFLADELWPEFAYGRNAINPRGHHGNALLSRHPIVSWRNHDVSVGGPEPRGLLHCTVQLGAGRELHAICVHLGLREGHREQQLEALCRLVASEVPPDAPLVVAGDFNDWRERAGARLARGCALDSAFARLGVRCPRTFPARWPVVPLDRIYVRHLQVHSACVLSTRPWPHLSDHLPLLAEVHP